MLGKIWVFCRIRFRNDSKHIRFFKTYSNYYVDNSNIYSI